MALKGNLRDFSLPQLLNLVNLAHKTGALTLRSDNGQGGPVCLYFREGRLIHAALANHPPQLTDILLKAGKLSEAQARAVRTRSRVGSDKELGLILIRSGYLSQNDIIQGVRSYLLESVYQLFGWHSGLFQFEANQLPPEERITVPLNLENVIIEGGRRQQEWDRLHEELPDLDIVIKFSAQPRGGERSINLTVEEWKVVSHINGRNTIHQIAELVSMSEFQIRRAISSLRRAGLIDMAEPEPEPPLPLKPAPRAKVSRSLLLRLIDGIRRR